MPGPAGPAEAGAGGAAGARPAARWPADWLVAVIPALAELVVGGYRIGVPSLWRDEAATISGSQRSLGAIASMLRHEDAVHAPYYVLMHPVIAVGGTSATVLRLPSLIAMTLAVGPDSGARAPARHGHRAARGRGGWIAGRPGADRGPADDQVRAGGQAVRAGHALRGRGDLRVRARAGQSAAALVGRLRRGLAAGRPVQPVRRADRGRTRGEPALARPDQARRCRCGRASRRSWFADGSPPASPRRSCSAR